MDDLRERPLITSPDNYTTNTSDRSDVHRATPGEFAGARADPGISGVLSSPSSSYGS